LINKLLYNNSGSGSSIKEQHVGEHDANTQRQNTSIKHILQNEQLQYHYDSALNEYVVLEREGQQSVKYNNSFDAY